MRYENCQWLKCLTAIDSIAYKVTKIPGNLCSSTKTVQSGIWIWPTWLPARNVKRNFHNSVLEMRLFKIYLFRGKGTAPISTNKGVHRNFLFSYKNRSIVSSFFIIFIKSSFLKHIPRLSFYLWWIFEIKMIFIRRKLTRCNMKHMKHFFFFWNIFIWKQTVLLLDI